MNIKKERFILNIENDVLEELIVMAKLKGVTVSWLLRSILFSLQKKYRKKSIQNNKIRRPLKFVKYFSSFPLYLYGDKEKWKTLARIWKVELGPLIRFGICEFFTGNLDIDFESVRTTKEVKEIYSGTFLKLSFFKRGLYLSLISSVFYKSEEYWKKDISNNIKLMNRGLSSRKYIRKLGYI